MSLEGKEKKLPDIASISAPKDITDQFVSEWNHVFVKTDGTRYSTFDNINAPIVKALNYLKNYADKSNEEKQRGWIAIRTELELGLDALARIPSHLNNLKSVEINKFIKAMNEITGKPVLIVTESIAELKSEDSETILNVKKYDNAELNKELRNDIGAFAVACVEYIDLISNKYTSLNQEQVDVLKKLQDSYEVLMEADTQTRLVSAQEILVAIDYLSTNINQGMLKRHTESLPGADKTKFYKLLTNLKEQAGELRQQVKALPSVMNAEREVQRAEQKAQAAIEKAKKEAQAEKEFLATLDNIGPQLAQIDFGPDPKVAVPVPPKTESPLRQTDSTAAVVPPSTVTSTSPLPTPDIGKMGLPPAPPPPDAVVSPIPDARSKVAGSSSMPAPMQSLPEPWSQRLLLHIVKPLRQ